MTRAAIIVLEHSSIADRVIMDFFKHRYYRTPKMLMTVIGQWPYQTARTRYGSFAVIIIVSISSGIPIFMAAVEFHDDRTVLLDCLTAFSFGIPCCVELVTFVWNSKKMLQLLDRIRADWLIWCDDREVNVLHEYADRGMKFTIVYTAAMFLMVTVYMVEPIVPKIIDVVLNNGSKPGQFPVPVYFHHLDAQEYYFYIIIYTCLCIFMVLTIIITYNVMILVYVQHGCALFAAVGNMLQRIGCNETPAGMKENKYFLEKEKMEIEQLICSSISRHSSAIEYVKLIEKTYSWTFLVITIFRTAVLSMTGFQIIKKTNEPQETVKFIVVAAGMIFYVYMESYLAHVLLDHSISIRYYIQNGKWYCLSLRAQKLLQFMLMRCNIPCQLTAGKVIKMSVESFVVFLKSSVSYLTVLRTI